ncbi:MAG: transketolase family protein, partial [Burkholderiales bacterium]
MATRIELANAVRALAMDAVQKANSGHPGMPMGMADIAEVLWRHHLRYNPANPRWPNRDRFVLSNGHGSMLLYALLHLTGYDLPMEQLKRFRQLHSMTPGHPEYGCAPGVETTTGPLGQGLSNAVGMAIAEKILAAEFNRPDAQIVEHHTYVFVGDGCLMEGISHEACSLAGVLKLGKLIAVYDDNGISIDSEKGKMPQWFADDTPKRFEAYGWHVMRNVDGHDPDAVDGALRQAKAQTDQPSLICCKTVIAKGAPNKQNTGAAHGAPLGEAEVAAARNVLGWNYVPFEIPQEIYAGWDHCALGAKLEAEWNEKFAAYRRQYPAQAAEFTRRIKADLPASWRDHVGAIAAKANEKGESIATRKASQNTIEALGPMLPELTGGSADLAASNLTLWSGSRALGATGGGNYVFYGVREFGMVGALNGLTLHGGVIPYGGTFLVFSDYARNALRLAALMKIRTI